MGAGRGRGMNTEKKVVLITGASGELGLVLVRKFREKGAEVVAVRHRSPAQEPADFKVEADLREPDAVRDLFKAVSERYGRLDVLINNAGVSSNELVAMGREETWMEALEVNLLGTARCCREALRLMLPRRRGVILNISSLAGLRGRAGQGAYGASKAALESLTRTLALEVARKGVRVNAIAPGFLEGRMVRTLEARHREALLSSVPLKRLGTMEEVAAAAFFLSSDEASYVTGQVIRIDGGAGM